MVSYIPKVLQYFISMCSSYYLHALCGLYVDYTVETPELVWAFSNISCYFYLNAFLSFYGGVRGKLVR